MSVFAVQGLVFCLKDLEELDEFEEEDSTALSLLVEDIKDAVEDSGYDIFEIEEHTLLIGSCISRPSRSSFEKLELLDKKDRENFFAWAKKIFVLQQLIFHTPPDRDFTLDVYLVDEDNRLLCS